MITGTTDIPSTLSKQILLGPQASPFLGGVDYKKGSCISRSDLKPRHYTDYHTRYLSFSADKAALDWPWLK